MSTERSESRTAMTDPPATGGYLVPITGLLAFVFALVAGASAYPAISSGSIGLATLPVIFAAASLLCLRLRQRYQATE